MTGIAGGAHSIDSYDETAESLMCLLAKCDVRGFHRETPRMCTALLYMRAVHTLDKLAD